MSKKKKKGGDDAPVSESHPMKDLLANEMKIMHLGEKIKRFAKDAKVSQEKYRHLEQEYLDYKKHQEDITTFLNEKLDDQYNKIDELEHLVVNLRLEKKNFGTDLENKFEEETGALESELTQSKVTIEKLESELSSLNTFKAKKEEVEKHVARLEEELALVKEETRQQLLQLDRQHIRQKEQMASQIKERIAETEKVTWAKWQSMYDDNTKRAMKRNKDMTIELKYQSRAAEKLMSTNKQLQAKNKEAQQQIKVYKTMQEEFAKSIQAYKRQIKLLREKVTRYEEKSFIDLVETQAPGSARSRSGNREGASATVINMSLDNQSGRKSRKGSGSRSGSRPGSSGASAQEVERLREQVAKYRAKARQAADEAAAAKKMVAAQNANVDFLGSFLLTAMEDLRKRRLKLAKVPITKRLPRDAVTGEIEIPETPYIQMPLQSREELVSEFIKHVRSLKLQVATSTSVVPRRPEDALPKIPGAAPADNISAPAGNNKSTQCSIGVGTLSDSFGSSLWMGSSQGTFVPSPTMSRENLNSRAFITSAQPEYSAKMQGQGLSMSHDSKNRPYTLH